MDLRGVGQTESAQRAFESVDQLATLALVRAAVARQRRELVADTLQRLGDRRRELAQVAAQARSKTKRVVRTLVGAPERGATYGGDGAAAAAPAPQARGVLVNRTA